MSAFDRKAFNDSIVALQTATAANKAIRADYMKEIREVGTELRKKLCSRGGPTEWIHNTFSDDKNSFGHKYGMHIVMQGQSDAAINAIISYITDRGFLDARVRVSDAHHTSIVAY